MEFELGDREYGFLRRLIYEVAGINLNDNKKHLLTSRLGRRLRAHSFGSYREYCNLLSSIDKCHPEMQELINCVTTNKTDFYRESHHFDFMRERVIPEFKSGRNLRIWHAGCSSGEETYTMAMTLYEAIPDIESWNLDIISSDIDTKILADAERGIYDESRVDPVQPSLIKRYFLKGKGDKEGMVKFRNEYKRGMSFQQVNLLAPNWGLTGPFEVIMCRNVMIYFDKETQAKLVERFQNALRPGGYLMVGHSESLNGIEAGLTNLGKTIYHKPAAAGQVRRAA